MEKETNTREALRWQDGALCAQTDPEAFVLYRGASMKMGRKICAMCDVTESCLAYALENDVEGLWGGTSDAERAKLRKQAA